MKCAIYARVSTTHHGQNPDVQVEELRRYCAGRGWTVHEVIVDHGMSGGSDRRPGLKRLMELVHSRQIECVVVVKMDRLFRSLKHLMTILDWFQNLGIQFVATKDSVDWTTPAGKLFTQILGSLAEFEKALLIERTRMGLEHAKRSGKRLGRPKYVNESEIVVLLNEGRSYRYIQKRLGVGMGTITRASRAAPNTPINLSEKKRIKSNGGHSNI